MKHINRLTALVAVLVAVLVAGCVLALTGAMGGASGAGPAKPVDTAPDHASAATAVPVGIVAHTVFSTEPSAFTSDLDGCEAGTVSDGPGKVHNTPSGGVFKGDKVFACTGGESGFTVQLKARFDEAGSTGSWTVSDGWGGLDGLKGSGSLVGTPTEAGIDDVYTGTAR